MSTKLKRQDLVHPELSFKIVGCGFEIFNELGFGHAEKVYQKALAAELKNKGLQFKEQVYTPLKYKEEIVGKFYLDFLVDEKVIVELKKNANFSKKHIDQVNGYLATNNILLALLINFTPSGVVTKRMLKVSEKE